MNKLYILLCFVLLSCAGQTRQVNFTWQDNIDYSVIEARESHKLILLYFYGTNCEWCEDQNIVINDKINEKLLKKFVLVKVNVEKSELARSSGITTIPTIIILYPTEHGIEVVSSNVGYLGKDEFKLFMNNSVKKSNGLKGNLRL